MGFLDTDAKAKKEGEVPLEALLPSPEGREEGDGELGRALLEELRASAETLRYAAAAKTLRALAHLSEEDRARVEALSRAVLEAFLEEPARRPEALGGAEGELLRELFGLGRRGPGA